MKTRTVIGKRIVSVVQRKTSCGSGRDPAYSVRFLELENGVRLRPIVIETETDYLVDFVATEPGQRK